ncbi:MAG: DnaA regulatory inactivator Hda [Sulfuricella sp.]|jgi:DnaA family protein|nr:DnaA regulatory inactivator Hda [Sulfuricella sp.]
MKQLLLDIAATVPPTLENFLPGRNAELLHALRAILQGEVGERFIYLWGESGSGRSHLLRAWILAAQLRGLPAAYVPGGIPLRWADGGLIAVDDVARLDQDGQIALFHLYNRLKETGGALLVSGPVAPGGLCLRPDLLTRLGWGLVYQVHGLNDEEKAIALQAHARERGFSLPQEVLDYLLRHWRRDLPSLMVVLDALDRYTLEQQRPVTLPLLRQLLQLELEL